MSARRLPVVATFLVGCLTAVQAGNISIGALLFAFAAGVGIAVQSAINGRVSRVSRQPMSAAFLNFCFGTAALAAAVEMAWAFTDQDPAPLPGGGRGGCTSAG